jgi:hypothetical protein
MKERRKHPRVAGAWDVTVVKVTVDDLAGRQWPGKSVNLSPGGLKVRFDGDLAPGSVVSLLFTPPDGGPMISAVAAVVRKDAGGHSFAFASLSYADYVRLRKFVRART